ncbi:MAG: hypothetical protein WBW88_10105 [Rhodothermales bacterium]
MDNLISTASTLLTGEPVLFATLEYPVGWRNQPANVLRMSDEDEDDEWTAEDDDLDDDLEEDDEEWSDEDDDDDDDDDDFDDDFDDDEEEDWIDDDDDADDYEYEYRGDPSWNSGDEFDDDEYSLLGARFSSQLDNPSSRPRRFRDRDGAPKGDKKPKKSHRPRVASQQRGEIENDDD